MDYHGTPVLQTGMVPEYISDLVKIKKHKCYSLRSTNEPLLLMAPTLYCKNEENTRRQSIRDCGPCCLEQTPELHKI